MKFFLAALLSATAFAAQANTAFDTFEGPRYAAQYGMGGTDVLRADAPSSLPGITRSLQLLPTPGATGSMSLLVSGDADGDILYGGADGEQRLSVSLSYGLDRPMNFDFSGASAFQLLVYYGGPLKLTVYAFTDPPDAADNPLGSALSIDMGVHYQSVLTLPMSAFSPNDDLGQGVDWRDVDRLSFAFSGFSDGGSPFFGLYAIALQPVPEPATSALLLLGWPWLLARLRGRARLGPSA